MFEATRTKDGAHRTLSPSTAERALQALGLGTKALATGSRNLRDAVDAEQLRLRFHRVHKHLVVVPAIPKRTRTPVYTETNASIRKLLLAKLPTSPNLADLGRIKNKLHAYGYQIVYRGETGVWTPLGSRQPGPDDWVHALPVLAAWFVGEVELHLDPKVKLESAIDALVKAGLPAEYPTALETPAIRDFQEIIAFAVQGLEQAGKTGEQGSHGLWDFSFTRRQTPAFGKAARGDIAKRLPFDAVLKFVIGLAKEGRFLSRLSLVAEMWQAIDPASHTWSLVNQHLSRFEIFLRQDLDAAGYRPAEAHGTRPKDPKFGVHSTLIAYEAKP